MIKVGNQIINYGHYPDGTINIKIPFISPFRCFDSSTINWLYDSEEEVVVLAYLVNHMRKIGYDNIYLNVPYLPNARMDRCETNEDVFTLKYFADILNSIHFNLVQTLDVHSTVSEVLINNIKNESPISFINFVLGQIVPFTEKELTIFYPDAGSVKRYSKQIKKPYIFGNKVRDWETGQIQGLDVIGDHDLIEGHDILIIDDICSRGGTFYHAAKKLKSEGAANIYLWVTHCENTILDGELINSGLVEKIYTTDSIFTAEHELIDVVSTFR